ncbi:MAG: hypothetical protein U0929_16545 [Planctomycetaceae bacterium]
MRLFNACSPCCAGIRFGVEQNGVNAVGTNCLDQTENPVDRQHWNIYNGKDNFFYQDRNYGIVGMLGTFIQDQNTLFRVWTEYDFTIAQWFGEWVWNGGRLVICGDMGGIVPEGKKIPYSGRTNPNTSGKFYGIHQDKLELNNSFLGTMGSSISFQEGMYGFSTSTGSGTSTRWTPTYCQVAGNYPITKDAYLIPNYCCCEVRGGTTLFTDEESGTPIGAIEKIGSGYVLALGSAVSFFTTDMDQISSVYVDTCPLWENWYLTEYDDLLQFSQDE